MQTTYAALSATEQAKQYVFLQCAKVILYDQTAQMVDLWGDIPFSKANSLNTATRTVIDAPFDDAAAIYDTLKITAHVQGDPKAEVKASGKALKSKGFLEVLGIVDDSKIEIPQVKVGDVLQQFGKIPVQMDKKSTQPTASARGGPLGVTMTSSSAGRSIIEPRSSST